MQYVLTASIYSIATLSALYFAVGFILHMANRFNAIQLAKSVVLPVEVSEPQEASSASPVAIACSIEECTVEEFAIADILPRLEELAEYLDDENLGFDIGDLMPIDADLPLSEQETVKLPLEEMTFAELQQACKDRWISIREGSKWVKKADLKERLRAAGH